MVREKFTIYERILYSDKTEEWNPYFLYAGECDEKKKKVSRFNSQPVETTKWA